MRRVNKITMAMLLVTMLALSGLGIIDVRAQTGSADCIEYGDYTLVEHTLPDLRSLDGMIVVGDYAYTADYHGGIIQIVDIRDLSAPEIVNEYQIPGSVGDLRVEGSLLYTSSAGTFWVFDISTPGSLEIVGDCGVPTYGYVSYIDTYHAFLTTGSDSIVVVNIADPEAPYFERLIYCEGTAWGLEGLGRYIAVYILDHGLSILDLATHGTDEVAFVDGIPRPHDIDLHNGVLFINHDDGVVLVDVEDPLAPTIISEIHNPRADMWNMAVSDDWVVCGAEEGLFVYDIKNLSYPEYLTMAAARQYQACEIVGNHVLTINSYDHSSFAIVDLSTPALPIQGSTPLQVATRTFSINGHWAYVVDREVGLEILDVSDVAHPVSLGLLSDTDYSGPAAELNGYLYLHRSNGHEVRIIDVRDPASPVDVGGFESTHGITDLKSDGQYLYLIRYNYSDIGEFAILRADDPMSPVVVGTMTVVDAHRLDVDGDVAYLMGGAGLFVADISDPTSPAILSSTICSNAYKLIRSGDYAYILYGSGVMVYDVSDPYLPYYVNAVHLGSTFSDMVLSNEHLYLSRYRQPYLCIVDISDPFALEAESDIAMHQEFWAEFEGSRTRNYMLAVYGETVFVSGNTLTTLLPQCAESTTFVESEQQDSISSTSLKTGITGAAPNPFNPETTVSFRVQTPEQIRLAVYDVQGRLVQQLASGVFQSGDHQVTWRGRDNAGRNVSSGVYLIRLQGENAHSSIRVSLLK